MYKNSLLFFIILGLLQHAAAQSFFDKEGHRGCRGLMPENSIPAMFKALDWGVTTLEMDLVISKDKAVVVSHDPYMCADFMLMPDGNSISAADEKKYNLYSMNYSEIRRYKLGVKTYPRFPRQMSVNTYKPLFSELIDSVENYAARKHYPAPHYNVEIKSVPEEDNVFSPEPPEFVSLVLDIIRSKKMDDRIIIQSFDIRPLKIIHQQYPHIKLSYLVENLRTVNANLELLGFTPDFYSPYYKMVSKKAVKTCHDKNIKIIPWTVNSEKDILKLKKKGVDGVITDYPDLFKQCNI